MKTEDILTQCIQELEAGTTSVEKIAAQYPKQLAELERLLRLHFQLEELPKRIVLSGPTKARIRARLLAEIRDPGTARRRSFLSWLPAWELQPAGFFDLGRYLARPAAAALILLTTFGLAGAGTVSAAMDSIPGDSLYPLKEATEQARLVLSFSDTDRADAYLWIASNRVRDLSAMAESGRLDFAPKVVGEYEQNVAEALRLASVRKQDNQKIQAQINVVQTDLHELYDKAPQELQLHLAQTLSLGGSGSLMAADPQASVAIGGPAAPPSTTGTASADIPNIADTTGNSTVHGIPTKEAPPVTNSGSPDTGPAKTSPISTEPLPTPAAVQVPTKGNSGPAPGPVSNRDAAPAPDIATSADKEAPAAAEPAPTDADIEAPVPADSIAIPSKDAPVSTTTPAQPQDALNVPKTGTETPTSTETGDGKGKPGFQSYSTSPTGGLSFR